VTAFLSVATTLPHVATAYQGSAEPTELHQHFQSLELMTGIEPVTSPLPRECSTN
jgi:hypothetical protein